MDIQPVVRMSPREAEERAREVNELNAQMFKDTAEGRAPKQALGKEDFLQLLTKQLAYQDPMAPMEDKEFIAQMAQFSSLEQMTAMSQGFTKLSQDFNRIANVISGGEAASALGKPVEIDTGEKVEQGVVKAVSRGTNPQVLVNGAYYNWENVTRVFEN